MRPRIGGYWFGPSMSACAAARLISMGPSSSGKPCPRLIALCSLASVDITVKIVVGRPSKTGLKREDIVRPSQSRSDPDNAEQEQELRQIKDCANCLQLVQRRSAPVAGGPQRLVFPCGAIPRPWHDPCYFVNGAVYPVRQGVIR